MPPQTQEQPQAGPSSSVPPPAHIPSDPAPQDEAERPSSPDPLDFLGQQASEQDALIADALQALSAEQSDCFTLSEAVEFAFNANSEMRLPSEPNQWKDIAGRPDASKWHDAAMEEFNALLENGTFEPVQLPAGRKAIGCRWVFKLK